jgi:hypothetical protein
VKINKFILILMCLIFTSCASLRNPTEEELEEFKKESSLSNLRTMVGETAMDF